MCLLCRWWRCAWPRIKPTRPRHLFPPLVDRRTLLLQPVTQHKLLLHVQYYFTFQNKTCLSHGGNKVKIWQKSLSPTFWLHPTPRGMWCQWSVRNPYMNLQYMLVTVSSPKLSIVSGTDLRADKLTYDPITRCPRRTFQAGGIKMFCLSATIAWLCITSSRIQSHFLNDVFLLCHHLWISLSIAFNSLSLMVCFVVFIHNVISRGDQRQKTHHGKNQIRTFINKMAFWL